MTYVLAKVAEPQYYALYTLLKSTCPDWNAVYSYNQEPIKRAAGFAALDGLLLPPMATSHKLGRAQADQCLGGIHAMSKVLWNEV